MPQKLYIHYKKDLVGSLKRDDEGVYSFIYNSKWLEKSDAFALSISMPLRKEAFGNKISLSFFENLLPEGYIRKDIEHSTKNVGVYQLLKEYGQDCAGAFTISSTKEVLSKKVSNSLKEISAKLINETIYQKRSIAEVISRESGYLSLAGAQDKFACIFKDSKFYIPMDGSPTTHIVKTPIWRSSVRESVYNEFYCMSLARAVGLKTSDMEIFKTKNYPLLVIKRYDRMVTKTGDLARLHQQDFCQAQGISSEEKYEEKGGPNIKDNYELILNHVHIKKRQQNIKDFLNWLAFNLIIGNNDCHSKNLSFLMNPPINTGLELSPFYDLLCTSVYEKLEKDFPYSLGHRSRIDKIGANQIRLLETELGLKQGVFSEHLKDMHNKVNAEKNRIAKQIKKDHSNCKVVDKIISQIRKRSKALKLQKALD